MLTMEPEIDQAVVEGDKKPWLAAVIVPAPSLLETTDDDETVRKAVAGAVERCNHRLSKLEHVRRFILADEPFTVDNAQMTATLKARRHVIRDVYGARLDALYPRS
jgi:long-chain acyl-CoA synthetase